MGKRNFSLKRKRAIAGTVFISPNIIGFFVFFAYPIVFSLLLSISTITDFVGMKMEYTGFIHYNEALRVDIDFLPYFYEAVRDTFTRTPLIIIFSLILSILLNKKIKGRAVFRMIFFLPFILGSGYVMNQLLGSNIDENTVGIARGIFLTEKTALYLGPKIYNLISSFLNIITMVLWKSGVQILLFLSALQTVPQSLYESAKVDSANEWDMFWKITLPMVTPVILVNIVYTIVDSFMDMNNRIF